MKEEPKLKYDYLLQIRLSPQKESTSEMEKSSYKAGDRYAPFRWLKVGPKIDKLS